MIQVMATTRSGLMPDKRARSSLSLKARMDFPVRVLFRNQNSAATTIIATTTVRTVVALIASPSRSPVISRNSRAVIRKACAVRELLIVHADDEAHDAVHHEHHAHRNDDKDHRRSLFAPGKSDKPACRFPTTAKRSRRCRRAVPEARLEAVPSETPNDCSHHVIRIVAMAPKAMVSPWAKFENAAPKIP